MPAYTSHGWQIPHSVENHPRPDIQACGGPGICQQCTYEVSRWAVPTPAERSAKIDETLKRIGYILKEDAEEPDDLSTFDVVRHDDNTLVKVLAALFQSGLNDIQARDAITSMQNEGILFRERI